MYLSFSITLLHNQSLFSKSFYMKKIVETILPNWKFCGTARKCLKLFRVMVGVEGGWGQTIRHGPVA